MDPQLKKNLSSAEYWFRAIYVVLFLLFAKLAGTLLALIALAQILFTIITGQANARLVTFGGSLALYLYGVFKFVTCQSEEKPFPFADWPVVEPGVDDESSTVINPEPPSADSTTQEKTATSNSVETPVKESTEGAQESSPSDALSSDVLNKASTDSSDDASQDATADGASSDSSSKDKPSTDKPSSSA